MSSPTLPNPDLPRGVAADAPPLPGRRFHQDANATLSDFERVGWQEFERLVGAGFHHRGFQVEATPDGADGGVDLDLARGGERAVVQVKHWPNRRVGVDKVRQLFGVMQLRRVPAGYLVSSGDFTQDAWAEAQRCGIYLVRGADTLALVNEAITAGHVVPHLVAESAPGVPRCPICREPMVDKIARKGQNAGTHFWGCPRFPACQGTRPMPASNLRAAPPATHVPSIAFAAAPPRVFTAPPTPAQPARRAPTTGQSSGLSAMVGAVASILLFFALVWLLIQVWLPRLIGSVVP